MMKVDDTVTLVCTIYGVEYKELRVISDIDDYGIWLDDGCDGPYHPATGEWRDNDVIPMSRRCIRATEVSN